MKQPITVPEKIIQIAIGLFFMSIIQFGAILMITLFFLSIGIELQEMTMLSLKIMGSGVSLSLALIFIMFILESIGIIEMIQWFKH